MRNFTKAFCLLVLLSTMSRNAFALTVTETHTNVSCKNGSNGSINLTATGGALPYTYNWNDGATTEDRSGIAAGIFSVTVTDNIGATATLSVVITEPTALVTSTAITHVGCGGGNTGAIDLTVIGGTPGYTYVWNDFVTTQDRSNLTAAVYYFTVTDSKGCTKVDSANVTQPAGMVLSKTTTNVTCGSGANGGINLTVQFGTTPYTFLWNDGATTEDRTGIAAGNYTVTVTDGSACTASLSATITQSGGGMAINTSTIQPACFGGSTGTINVTNVIGSVGPYTFKWNDGPTTQNRTGVAAGAYTVTATSTTGCTASANVNLGQPTQLVVNLTPIAVLCYGGANGAINTSVSGGSSPYSYNWGGGVVTQNRTALTSGTYTVTVTDNKGCTISASTSITQPLQLNAASTPSPLACSGGPTGSIYTNVVGGIGPYSYNWGGGVVTPDRININSGTYNVTVTDANGCTASTSAVVPPYTPMTTSSTQVNNICYGGNVGSINLTVSNGNGPFSYIWSNTATTEDINALAAGSYTVSVTDANACTVSRTVSITQPGLAISINATVTNISCFGLSNGAISVSATNGVSPYTFNWGSGITGNSRTNLAQGNYVVTATDNNGCTAASAPISVTQPSAISSIPSVTNATCFGSATGNISLTTSGSFSPYTYVWSNAATTSSINVGAGTYTATITDNHSCTATATATVTQNPAINVASTLTHVTCNGGNNGAINITVTGGVGPYSYNWGGGIVSEDRTVLTSGTYTVTVTDNASCTSTSSFTINPGATVSATSVVTNVTCNSANTGAINLTPSGVNSPFTFNWGGGVTTEDRTNIAAGNYTVTITDNAGCTATHTASVTQATSLAVSATSTNVSCFGASTGTINVSVSGGNAPYTYNWGGGVTTQNRTGLSANTYTVTVTDNALCTVTNSTTITQSPAIAVTSVITNVACAGGNSGAIDVSVTGGTSPFTYNWGGGVTTQDRTNLAGGTYSLTVTDNASCTATHSATVVQNPSLILSSVLTGPSCFGGANGAINLTVSGGTAPYTYNWNGGVNTQDRTNLTIGTYAVTVTDNFGCSGTHSATITQPTAVSGTIAVTNVTCNGANTGALNLTPAGGTSPYTFNWGGGITTEDRTSVAAGNYSVTITDNNSCTASVSATITQPVTLSAAITKTNAACFAQASGSATATATGGTSPFNYIWTNASTSPSISALLANTYSVTVTDANSCTASASTTITQPTAIVSSVVVNDADCYGIADGNIDLTVSGGTGGFSYLWNNNANTQDLWNVAAGNYAVTITDANGCTNINNAAVNQPTAISLNAVKTNIVCSGANSGTISLNPTGGQGPFIFNWSNGNNTANLTNLAVGNYTATVFDNNSCSVTQTFSITQTTPPAVSLVKTNITCNGANNGTITTTVSGGNAPFSFVWNDGNTNQNRTGLAVAAYTVTASDANGCSASATTSITTPSALALSTTKINVLCNGANTGSIDLTVTGGTLPYSYAWSNGWSIQDLSGVAAGTYSVTVNDANNCSATTSNTIAQPSPITIGVSVSNVTCNGANNGGINTTVSGGNGGYNYAWSNGGNTQNLSGANAGIYTLSVTDAMNCLASLTMNITQPAAMTLSQTHTNIQCSGATGGSIDLSVIGGATPYTYIWSNGATTQDINNLQSGTYTVTVQDVNNCSSTLSTTVTSPSQINLATAVTHATCFGASTGAITLTVTGGGAPFSYNWGNGVTTQNRTNIPAGTYSVTVTDASTCSSTISATVNQPTAIQIAATTTATSCFGASNGAAQVTVSGGASGYQYIWNSGETTAAISGKNAGSYTISVTDANACQATATAAISSPSAVQIAETHTNATCNASATGAINITVTGGNGGFNFVWSNAATTEDITALAAGTFTVTATDANACSAQRSITITEPAALAISATHTDYACATQPGSINVTVVGGTSPYSFVWNNSATTEDLSNITAGNYDVLVTDNNGCNQTYATTVLALPAMSSTITNTNLSCFGAATASVDLTVTGGTLPYSFVWNNSATTEDLSNLTAGVYDVVISDASNCAITNSATVTQPAAIQVTPIKTDISCFGGNNGQINVVAVGGTSPYTFTWNNNSNAATITSLSAGSFQVTVTDANNCSQASTTVITEPTILATTATVLPVGCSNNNDGAIDLTTTGGTPPYSFVWNNGRTTEDISGISVGNYDVVIKDANNCVLNHAEVVGVTPPIVLAAAVNNTPCLQVQKGSVALTVSGGTPGYTFDWSNGDNTQDIQNLAMGNYSVVVTDSRNCSAQQAFNIAADYVLEVQTTSDITIDLGNSAALVATTNVNHNNTYQWTPAYNVDCPSCAVTEASPTFNTEFTVNVTDENGCHAAASTNVKVNSVTDIFVPNAFTPNGDGNNDVMELYGDVATIKYLDFKVFNRWGELVFSSSNHNFKWDGTYKGQDVPTGAYIYTMDVVFINGYSRSGYKGSITILR